MIADEKSMLGGKKSIYVLHRGGKRNENTNAVFARKRNETNHSHENGYKTIFPFSYQVRIG